MTAHGGGHRPRRRRPQRARRRRTTGRRPCAGSSGIGRITRFDAGAATRPGSPARSPASTAEDHLPSRLLPQTDRMTRLALVAADWALARRRASTRRPARVRHGRGHRQLVGRLRVRPARAAEAVEQGRPVRQRVPVVRLVLRRQHRPDLHPARHARPQRRPRHASRPAASTRSAQARRQIRKGTRLVVSGGVDASICPWGWVAQLASGRLSTSDDPARAYLPFDAEAPRLRAGRGRRDPRPGGRRVAHATAAPRVYGEIAGYGATFDPQPGQRPASRACAGRSSWRSPTPASRPATSTWSSPTRRPSPSSTASRPRRSPRSSGPRGAGDRAQDDDRPAATPAPRRSTWRPPCWRSGTASSRRP